MTLRWAWWGGRAGDERKLNLIAQYEDLKTKGAVDKVVEKQRRRQASKDHRFMPYARRP